MTTKKVILSELQKEIQDWDCQVGLVKTELDGFKSQLEKIESVNTRATYLIELNEFRKKIEFLDTTVDELKDNIHTRNEYLLEKSKESLSRATTLFLSDHARLRQWHAETNSAFTKLKSEYQNFISTLNDLW